MYLSPYLYIAWCLLFHGKINNNGLETKKNPTLLPYTYTFKLWGTTNHHKKIERQMYSLLICYKKHFQHLTPPIDQKSYFALPLDRIRHFISDMVRFLCLNKFHASIISLFLEPLKCKTWKRIQPFTKFIYKIPSLYEIYFVICSNLKQQEEIHNVLESQPIYNIDQ